MNDVLLNHHGEPLYVIEHTHVAGATEPQTTVTIEATVFGQTAAHNMLRKMSVRVYEQAAEHGCPQLTAYENRFVMVDRRAETEDEWALRLVSPEGTPRPLSTNPF